jgi:mono/diheme cytochrome c family protein
VSLIAQTLASLPSTVD